MMVKTEICIVWRRQIALPSGETPFASFRKGDTSWKQRGINQQNNTTLSLGTVFNYTTSIYMPVTLMYL